MNRVLIVMIVVFCAAGIWVTHSVGAGGIDFYKQADLQVLTHPDIFKWKWSKHKSSEPVVQPEEKEKDDGLPEREKDPLEWKPLPEKTVYFDYDKSRLKPEGKAAIQRNVRFLKENPKNRILIEGHCDERGTPEYNLALGERRFALH